MKSLLRICILIIVVEFVPVATVLSGTDLDRMSVELLNAIRSGDTQAVNRTVVEVEKRWLDSPEGYFRFVRQVNQVLAGELESSAAKQCLARIFDSVSEKKKPGVSTQQDVVYFEQKSQTYLAFLDHEEIRKDKSCLLELARYVGEVRASMIPDYVNRGTSRPGLEILEQAGVNDVRALTGDTQVKAYEKAVKTNKEDLLMNELQSSLRRYDKILTFHLVHASAHFSRADFNDKEFRNNVIKASRLSEKEASKLRGEDR
jgi:hypothetical protein